MTREKAIGNLIHAIRWNDMPTKEALEMAIEALKQEPCEDAISRRAALDIIDSYSNSQSNVYDVTQDCISNVIALPSVQSKTKQEHREDVVSREAAISIIYDYEYKKDMRKALEDLPSVTPAKKVGRWIKSDIPNEEYVCSECGGACWYYDYEAAVAKSRYCPNCGCKMEVSE